MRPVDKIQYKLNQGKRQSHGPYIPTLDEAQSQQNRPHQKWKALIRMIDQGINDTYLIYYFNKAIEELMGVNTVNEALACNESMLLRDKNSEWYCGWKEGFEWVEEDWLERESTASY